jgi:hypothetical protein
VRNDASNLGEVVVVVMVLTVDRRPEVTDPVAERASDLWQALRAEHDQRDQEHEKQMCWLQDVADH